MKSETAPIWMLVVSGALSSTLAVRLGCRLRRAFGGKCSGARRKTLNGISEARRTDVEGPQARPSWAEGTDPDLHLVAVAAGEPVKDGGGGGSVAWPSAPERHELPRRPYGQSSGSDSPRGSESGSDGVLRRGEVQKKVREQLRRRDEMMPEMQAQVAAARGSLAAEEARSAHLRTLLDYAGARLAHSEGVLLRLRRVLADDRRTAPKREAADLIPPRNGWPRVAS